MPGDAAGMQHGCLDRKPGQAMAAPALTYAVLVPVVLFSIYRRLRRNFGRQPLRVGRIAFRVVLFALVALLLLGSGLLMPRLGLGGVAGLLGGAALGLYGLHLTRFEAVPQGRFYTPNGVIGIALTALLLGRLLYRFLVLSPLMSAGAPGLQDPGAMTTFQRSPLTLAIAGLLVGYYLAYYAGLLHKARALVPLPERAPAVPPTDQ
jgi:hypothetical protein